MVVPPAGSAGAQIDTGKAPRAALTGADYRVTKMKFAKTRDPATKKSISDKTTVIYNERITIRDIPLLLQLRWRRAVTAMEPA